MPIALDPGGKFPLVLHSDQDKPQESRPTFFARALCWREQKAEQQKLDDLKTSKLSNNEQKEKALDQLFGLLVGWTNINDPKSGDPIPFQRDTIDLVLGSQEIAELLVNAINNLFYEEKKS